MINYDIFKDTDKFTWFHGVVEDINDPEEIGRVKVRCLGFHNQSKTKIPTKDLPWAHVLAPVASASMTQIGLGITGLLQGSWVIGFFRDGFFAQDPIILGSIPSISSTKANTNLGFNDPDGKYPDLEFINEPDISRSARSSYKKTQIWKRKEEERVIDVPTAAKVDGDKGKWTSPELESYIEPKYPKNHVQQTESGHVIEKDDTKDKERISEFHKSGTYTEIDSDGNEIHTIVGDQYEIINKNSNVLIKGNVNLTIQGNVKTYIQGNYDIEVDGNVNEWIHGNRTIKVDGEQKETVEKNVNEIYNKNHDLKIAGKQTFNIASNQTFTIGSNQTFTIGSNQTVQAGSNVNISGSTVDIDGSTILLN